VAGIQAYPIELSTVSAAHRTCSRPDKATNNTGCQFFAICQEKSKGKYPVNVFAVDQTGPAVVWNHCYEWYNRLRGAMMSNGRARYTRIERPEKVRFKRAIAGKNPGEGSQTIVEEMDAPPIALRGETGSGSYSEKVGTNLDMLGPELRAQLGAVSADMLEADDAELPAGVSELVSGRVVSGPPVTVEHVSSASGAAARAKG
jgi:hypothetical protein